MFVCLRAEEENAPSDTVDQMDRRQLSVDVKDTAEADVFQSGVGDAEDSTVDVAAVDAGDRAVKTWHSDLKDSIEHEGIADVCSSAQLVGPCDLGT